MEIDIEVLPTPESISLGEAHYQLGSQESRCLSLEVGLDIEVVGFIKYAVETEVQ